MRRRNKIQADQIKNRLAELAESPAAFGAQFPEKTSSAARDTRFFGTENCPPKNASRFPPPLSSRDTFGQSHFRLLAFKQFYEFGKQRNASCAV
jgi:hypothetical protein